MPTTSNAVSATISDIVSVRLDFLRGLGAQLVLIGHLSFMTDWNELGFDLYKLADLGVIIFFIISGYLIAYSHDRGIKRNYTFKDYFINRFSRIYSVLLPALILITVLDLIAINVEYIQYQRHDEFTLLNFVGNLFCLQNHSTISAINQSGWWHEAFEFFDIGYYGTADVLWTLSLEWWLYVLFGSMAFRKEINKWYRLLLFAISLIFVFSNLFFGPRESLPLIWFLGVAIYKFRYKTIYKVSLIVLSVFSVYSIDWENNDLFYGNFLFFFCLTAFFLTEYKHPVANGLNRFLHVIISRPSRFFAKFSYSLYLIHLTLLQFMVYGVFFFNLNTLIIIIFMVCNFTAFLFYLLFEARHKEFRSFMHKIARVHT